MMSILQISIFTIAENHCLEDNGNKEMMCATSKVRIDIKPNLKLVLHWIIDCSKKRKDTHLQVDSHWQQTKIFITKNYSTRPEKWATWINQTIKEKLFTMLLQMPLSRLECFITILSANAEQQRNFSNIDRKHHKFKKNIKINKLIFVII